MDAAFFIFKSFIVTVLLVMVLQIKFGSATLENHIVSTARSAGVISLAQEFADSTSKLVRNSWNGFVGAVNKTFSIDKRSSPIDFERSKAYLKQKAENTSSTVRKELQDAGIIDETVESKNQSTE